MPKKRPDPAARTYFRHQTTGELGYLFVEEGKTYVRLDRPSQKILREFDKRNPGPWLKEVEYRPFARGQVVRVLYAADRELRFLLHEPLPKEFASLRDAERIAFTEVGPTEGLRKEVYDALKAKLWPLCR
jgi:hypothetical protein